MVQTLTPYMSLDHTPLFQDAKILKGYVERICVNDIQDHANIFKILKIVKAWKYVKDHETLFVQYPASPLPPPYPPLSRRQDVES